MPIITLTIQIDVPEGATVNVVSAQTEQPAPAPALKPIRVVREEHPEYPESNRAPGRPWTIEEYQYASDLNYSDAEIAELVGRTELAVHTFRRLRGIIPKSRVRTVAEAPRAMQRWTKSELSVVRRRWTPEENAQIAEKLGRTEDSVSRMAGRLGLKEKRTKK